MNMYPNLPWAKWLTQTTGATSWTLTAGDMDLTPPAFKELLRVACYEHGFNLAHWKVRKGRHTNDSIVEITVEPRPGLARRPAHDYVVRLWDDGRREEKCGNVIPFEWPWAKWFGQETTRLVYPVDFIKQPSLMIAHIRMVAERYGQKVETVRDARVHRLQHNWVGITINRDMTSPPYERRAGGRTPNPPKPPRPPKPAKVRGPIGRPEKHPWREWLDGRRHVLTRGVDFDMPAQQFAIMVRAKANTKRYPFGVTVQQRGQVVTVQARIEEAI